LKRSYRGQGSGPDDAILRHAGDRLHEPDCPARTAVDGEIEDGIVKAAGQIVLLDGAPIEKPVDLLDVLRGNSLEVGDRSVALYIAAVVFQRDAPIGGSARIILVVAEPALVIEHQRQSPQKVRFHDHPS